LAAECHLAILKQEPMAIESIEALVRLGEPVDACVEELKQLPEGQMAIRWIGAQQSMAQFHYDGKNSWVVAMRDFQTRSVNSMGWLMRCRPASTCGRHLRWPISARATHWPLNTAF
jgi:hypothetical protein